MVTLSYLLDSERTRLFNGVEKFLEQCVVLFVRRKVEPIETCVSPEENWIELRIESEMNCVVF